MPYCPFTARWQFASQQLQELDHAYNACNDPVRQRIIMRELSVLRNTVTDLRARISSHIQTKERARISSGGVIRIAGIKVPSIEPSENYRDEIISQIHSMRAHKSEDKILAKLLEPAPVVSDEIPESNRNCGVELEVTGCSRDQLNRLVNSVSNGSWHVVSDGTIPSVKNNCVHRQGKLLCSWCNKSQEECRCCGQLYTCSKPSCGASYSLGRIEQYRRDRSNIMLRCPDCRTLTNLMQFPCACNGGPCGVNPQRFQVQRTPCNCPREWQGGEVVSNPGHGPEWLKVAENVYDAICKQAEENNSKPYHKSGDHATGFHVHVDGSNLTQEQQALIVVYFNHLVENDTDFQNKHKNVLPSWRLNDFTYCRKNWLGDKKTASLYDLWKNNCGNRYKQVNLDSMSKHGTIEFRVGYVPKTGAEVVAWIKACKSVVDKVCSIPAEEMKKIKNFVDGHEVLTYKPLTEWLEKLDDMPISNAIFKPLRKFTAHV